MTQVITGPEDSSSIRYQRENVLHFLCYQLCFLLFVFIWIRGTLPRFRYDQLMAFAWKFMFPLALINLLITAFAVSLTS